MSHYYTQPHKACLSIGQSWREKVLAIRKELEKEGASALVVTALDEVACKCMQYCVPASLGSVVGLYNLRGSDVEYNPVFFSYAIVTLTDAR